MLISTKGIVVNTIKYGETSIITKLFTEDKGLLSFIVNGVRKHKGRGALFNPLNQLDVVVYFKEGKNLLRLKEYKLNTVYQSIPLDIRKSTVSLFILELLSTILKEEDENQGLYQFIESTIKTLDQSEYDKYFHLNYIIELMAFAGITPLGKYSAFNNCFDFIEGRFMDKNISRKDFITGKPAENLSHLIHKTGYGMNKTERNELLNNLLHYFQIHNDSMKPLRSLTVLQAVMS